MTRTLLIAAAVGSAPFAVAQQPGNAPDPQMQAVLDAHAGLKPKPIETLSPEEARKQPSPADAVKALLKSQGKSVEPEAVGTVAGVSIPGPAGAIAARVYTPKGDGPFPVTVYWHGGGFVIADLDTYDSSARALSNAAGCVVVSCHYRQAPEHPFPAAAEDALAAYTWVTKHTAELKADAKRIAVAGESAGGNLAAGVAIRARDGGLTVPVHQLLVYPLVDLVAEYPSYQAHAAAKPLNLPMLKWFGKHYLKNTADAADPKASPLRAADHAKLPPATIILAEIDPLQDQGFAYAAKLKSAGVPVTVTNYPGMAHEFFGMGAVVDKAKEAVGVAAAGLKAGFAAGR